MSEKAAKYLAKGMCGLACAYAAVHGSDFCAFFLFLAVIG